MGRRDLSFLILIVILGFALRFAFLTYNPPSLNWDEISHGYNAYSVLKTGMDQWGQRFPLFNFRAYGDYPTTLNLYLTIPFIAVLGLTEFAIRFPHVLLGTLTIISVYYLALGIFKRRPLSLLSAFLVAVGPWYVFTSRFVLQSNLSVFFLITAAAFFVNRDRNKNFLPVSLILLFLTLFSYHTTRIFSPIFLLGSVLIYKSEIKTRMIYLFAVLFIAFSAYILINPNATARGNILFIIDEAAVNKISLARNTSNLPNVVKRLIYNRPVYFVDTFAKNYISYFSPQFLFLKGGTQYQFSVPNFGLLYPVCLPFFYLGLIILIVKSIKDKNYRFLLLWIILAPVPTSLTNESYAVIRATTMLPIPEILVALGFYFLLEKIPGKARFITFSIFITIILFSLENYLTNYFTIYRSNYSWSWQYGYKEVVAYVNTHYAEYDKIMVTKKYGEPHEYFLYYLKYDPEEYLNDKSKVAFEQSNWWWVDRFDKFYFVNDWQIPKSGNDFILESKNTVHCPPSSVRCLLITSPGNYPKDWKKLDTVNFLDGSPAFEIYANN